MDKNLFCNEETEPLVTDDFNSSTRLKKVAKIYHGDSSTYNVSLRPNTDEKVNY